jgi:tripeptide aminopeptidase
MNTIKQKALERFLRYVKIDTRSQEGSDSFPSTKNQFDLAKLLVKELRATGCKDAHVDKHCYVMATLPATSNKKAPVIGLIAHLDTSPEVPGHNVMPKVIHRYGGGDIVINKKRAIVIREAENKELRRCIGHTLVTADGATLLGADDKAGVAAIMTAVQELNNHPEIPRGTVKIAFTPDEEVARGVDRFDLKKFNADFAYTVDGGFAGEINRETFSADSAVIEIQGRDIHPGYAKSIMINSIRVMADIITRLPKNMAPETTAGYEPFLHPLSLEGGVFKTTCRLLLRDFKTTGLKQQRKIIECIIGDVQKLYPKAAITLKISESYRNMRKGLEQHPHVTQRLWMAARAAGVSPRWEPIRGGTDGSRLTAMGLPCPNIFTGSGNHHSLTEWLSIDMLVKAVETIINVVKLQRAVV